MSATKSSCAFTSAELAQLIEQYGELVSYPVAEQITTVSRRTLGRMVDEGELRLYRVGSKRTPRFKTRELAALIQQVA